MKAKFLFLRNDPDEDEDQLECSSCDVTTDLLCRLPVIGLARGPIVTGGSVESYEEPWIGLCETCVRRMLDGFAEARAGIASEDLDRWTKELEEQGGGPR